MSYQKWLVTVIAAIPYVVGNANASLDLYSGNSNVPAGVTVFEYRNGSPHTAPGNPFFIEYGAAPKTVFGPQDKVYLTVGFDLQTLTLSDMVTDPLGTKYMPRVWWQIWAPGVSTSATPTWDHLGIYDDTWASILNYQTKWPNYHGPMFYDTYLTGTGDDLWSIGGGYQPGQWNFRLSVEVPDPAHDPWITLQSDGSWTAPFTPDQISFAPITGSRTAVPEPSTVVLIALGLFGIAAFRRKFE